MAKPLFLNPRCAIGERTLGRNPLKARTVVRPSVRKTLLFGIRVFIVVRKRLSVKSGRVFHVNSQLICHQLLCPGEKPYRCKEYGKNFTRSSNLVPHQKIPSGEKAYQSTFAMWEGLRQKGHVLIDITKLTLARQISKQVQD